MKATIAVEKLDGNRYRVTVSEAGEQSTHQVILKPDYHQKLTGGRLAPEELVRRSFEFLLEREPKESILEEFELPVIGRYFPEYEAEIKKRLGA
jgi:hypothetical protein